MENGGVPESANPSTLIKEAIHVIGCGYEEKTEWGKEVCILVLRYVPIISDTYLDDTRYFCPVCQAWLLVSFLFSFRLAGSMVQLQRIFWLGLRCTAVAGDPSTACRWDLHSRDQPLSIFPIVFTKFSGGLLVLSRSSSVGTARCGTVTAAAVWNGSRGCPTSTPSSTRSLLCLSLPIVACLPFACSQESSLFLR